MEGGAPGLAIPWADLILHALLTPPRTVRRRAQGHGWDKLGHARAHSCLQKGPGCLGPGGQGPQEITLLRAFVALTAVTASPKTISVHGCVCERVGETPSSPAQPGINPPNRLMTLSALKRRKRRWETNWGDQQDESRHVVPLKPQPAFGESASPLGSSGHLHGELNLHLGPQPDRTGSVRPSLGCPTGQDGVMGTNSCSSVHTWSRRSVPPTPPGMLSFHRALSPCQEPNLDLGCAALSPGTLVPHRCEQPEQTWAVCRAAAGMLARSLARCRARSSIPSPPPARSLQPHRKEKGFLRADSTEERICQLKHISCCF